MKNRTLKIKQFMCLVLTVAVFAVILGLGDNALKVNADDAQVVVSLDKNNVNVGDTFNVKVTYSSTIDSAYLEWTLSYDSSMVSRSGSAGKISESFWFEDANENTKNVTQTYSFTAKNVGKAVFSIEATSFKLDNTKGEESGNDYMTVKTSSASLTISDKGSSDATLSGLSLSSGELTPDFSPETTEYSVTVPFEVSTLYVYATENDAAASHTIEGDEFLEVGTKKRVVVVTAQDGTVKRYTIEITRLPKPTEVPTQTPTATATQTTAVPTSTPEVSSTPDEKITILIGDEKYHIYETIEEDMIPEGFEKTTVEYKEIEYEAVKGTVIDITLVCLTNNTEMSLFVYDAEKELFYPYAPVTVKSEIYTVLSLEEDNLDVDYEMTKIQIEGAYADAYAVNDGSNEFYIVKAMNGDGDVNYYCYDSVELTMQRYISAKISVEDEPAATDKVDASEVTQETQQPDNPVVKDNSKDSNNKFILGLAVAACILCVIFASALIFFAFKERKTYKMADFDESEDGEE